MGSGLTIILAVPNVVRCPKAWTKIMTMWLWQETHSVAARVWGQRAWVSILTLRSSM